MSTMVSCNCPYEYLLSTYGAHHFRPFVNKLRPSLSTEDPAKYDLVLDIMDAVHFCAILVDDIADRSSLRKNKATAHLVFGTTETINRAYLVLMGVINRAMREHPVLGVELLKSLEEIHQGQDESLVWRREGLEKFPRDHTERLVEYERVARLKTGSLFVLLGRLLNDGGPELDHMLSRFGWYAQLQNDCKNIYSAEYAHNKGAVAEDLRNGELSYPIIVGLNTDRTNGYVERALRTRDDEDIQKAIVVLESRMVRDVCFQALKEGSYGVEELIKLWGRTETMTNEASKSPLDTRHSDEISPETTSAMETVRNTTSDTSKSSMDTENGKKISPATTKVIDTVPQLSAADLTYWTKRCNPIVASLLKSCGVYSPADQDMQLRFLQDYVVPNLGPRSSGSKSQIVSMATYSGFPLQPSINLSSSGTAKLRYIFEPLDAFSGTTADPFALKPAKRMLSTLASQLGLWPGWIEALIAAYHPTIEQVEQIQAKLPQYLKETIKRTTGDDVDPPGVSRMWVCFIGLDLDGASQAMKAYFDPKVMEAATGIPSCKYALQVLRKIERFGNDTAVDMLERFLAERQSVGAVEVIAIDCVPECMMPSARIKVYVHTMTNSFNTVHDYVTLGGRRTDPATLQGLSRLREIWHLLLGEPNGIENEDWNKTLTGFSPMQHRLYFSYEMKPGNSDPAVKIYTPMQNYAPDDEAIVRNYEANFRQCGWPWGEDGAYRKVIENAFGAANLHCTSFLHRESSFIFSRGKGIYQSVYLDPPYETEPENDTFEP